MEVLQRLHNRGSISTGYDIDHSVKMEGDNSEYLTKTYSSAGNSKTWTISVWVKRTESGASTSTSHMIFGAGDTYLHFLSSDKLYANLRTASTNFFWGSDRVFRDTAAWYHIVMAVDTTQGTAADRVKVYVNGEQQTPTETGYQNISQNADTRVNSAVEHEIGKYTFAEVHGMQYAEYFHGYMSDMYVIDGSAKAPTDFGEFDTNGVWIPKAYGGSYGTNGFFLDFADAADLGDDESGNGNDWTEVNLTAADQATDTPTNNFCTWNPLWAFYRNSTITEGGTEVAGAAGGWSHAGATMGVMNGRWYWEWKITSTEIGFISFSTLEGNANLNQLGHDNSVIMGYAAGNLYTWLNGSQGSNESTGWGTWAVNDIISIFLDVENSDRRFTLYKNGSAISGTTSFPVSMPNQMQVANGGGNIFPYNVQYENDGGEWNFGGYTTMSNSTSYSDADGHGSFVYSPVLSGVNYYALCTKNLAEYG